MIRAAALLDRVTIYNPSDTGDTDRYGNEIDDEDEGTAVRASVAPLEATEDELNRDTRITRYMVLVAPTAGVDALSRIEWQGNSYQVIGEPLKHSNREGVHHLTLTIRGIEG